MPRHGASRSLSAFTANLGIRNDAAHRHYDEYEKSHISALIDRVRAFIDKLSGLTQFHFNFT